MPNLAEKEKTVKKSLDCKQGKARSMFKVDSQYIVDFLVGRTNERQMPVREMGAKGWLATEGETRSQSTLPRVAAHGLLIEPVSVSFAEKSESFRPFLIYLERSA